MFLSRSDLKRFIQNRLHKKAAIDIRTPAAFTILMNYGLTCQEVNFHCSAFDRLRLLQKLVVYNGTMEAP